MDKHITSEKFSLGVPEKVGIVSVGYEGFRPLIPDLSTREMMFQAAYKAYKNASIDPRKDIDSFICCTEDFWEGWSITDEMVPDQIGAARRSLCTVCQDGINGIANAYMQIASGIAETVAVESHSKLGDVLTKELVEELGVEPIYMRSNGVNTDMLSALEMDYFMRNAKVSRQELNEVIIQEMKRALRNPRACFGLELSSDEVESSDFVVEPLRELDKARYSEGSIVVVLASERWIKKRKMEAVYIDGIGWNSSIPWYDGGDVVRPGYAKKSFEIACSKFNRRLRLDEIDLIEVDDTYSYKLIQHLLALGFSKREAFSSFRNNQVNSSGGSIGSGNLVEANGLLKVLECYLYLKERGGRALALSWRGQPTSTGACIILSG